MADSPPVRPTTGGRPTLRRSRKARPCVEVACEVVYRPLAHLVVLALAPLRVPPPALVAANMAAGLAGAGAIAEGHLIAGALLLQVKTVLDNADGQLARATGRVSVAGRYLDSESDLLVNAAVFGALGHVTGRPLPALVAFCLLTLVLSVDFNLERLYRRERGEPAVAMPEAHDGVAAALARIYAVVYAPQDRLVERFVEWRLGRLAAGPEARLAYHDAATLQVVANFGLSTQLAALGLCLAAGRPAAYFAVVGGCAAAVAVLAALRELRVRRLRGGRNPVVDPLP